MAKLTSLKPKVATISTARTTRPVVQRIRGRAGCRMRERILKRDGYLCQGCLRRGRVAVATDVDHILPLHQGGSNADSNQESLCRECHDQKSERERQGREA